jgi:hypothetical protein
VKKTTTKAIAAALQACNDEPCRENFDDLVIELAKYVLQG